MKILVLSNEDEIENGANEFKIDYDRSNQSPAEIVSISDNWRLGPGEVLIVFAHGSMADESNDSNLQAYIGDYARPGRNQSESDSDDDEKGNGRAGNEPALVDHCTPEQLSQYLQNRLAEGSKVLIQACESADVNLDLLDNEALALPDGRVRLPDSFAGALQELAGSTADVKGRSGKPNLESPKYFAPDSPIWKTRVCPREDDNADDARLFSQERIPELSEDQLLRPRPAHESDEDQPSDSDVPPDSRSDASSDPDRDPSSDQGAETVPGSNADPATEAPTGEAASRAAGGGE